MIRSCDRAWVKACISADGVVPSVVEPVVVAEAVELPSVPLPEIPDAVLAEDELPDCSALKRSETSLAASFCRFDWPELAFCESPPSVASGGGAP